LGELVKCKTSKTIFQPKFLEMPDISGLQTEFQRGFLDMSDPQPGHVRASLLPQRLSPWPDLSNPLTRFERALSKCMAPSPDMSGLLLIFGFPSLSDSLTRLQNSNQICLSPNTDMSILLALSRVKAQNRTCPVPWPGFREVSRTCTGF
jgi:hypothetical protein